MYVIMSTTTYYMMIMLLDPTRSNKKTPIDSPGGVCMPIFEKASLYCIQLGQIENNIGKTNRFSIDKHYTNWTRTIKICIVYWEINVSIAQHSLTIVSKLPKLNI